MSALPVAVEPVRLSTRTAGCSASTAPITDPRPGTICTTPSGRPASRMSGAVASAMSGVSSAGFHTHAQPAATAAATFLAPCASGKFQGVISPATPAGRCSMRNSRPASGWGAMRPYTRRASSPNHWKKLAAYSNSPAAWA